MWKLGISPRSSFPGNICFEFLVSALCSAHNFSPKYLSDILIDKTKSLPKMHDTEWKGTFLAHGRHANNLATYTTMHYETSGCYSLIIVQANHLAQDHLGEESW